MSRCITVKTSIGVVKVNVADGVVKLPKSDVEQLEQFIAHVKSKRKPKSP